MVFGGLANGTFGLASVVLPLGIKLLGLPDDLLESVVGLVRPGTGVAQLLVDTPSLLRFDGLSEVRRVPVAQFLVRLVGLLCLPTRLEGVVLQCLRFLREGGELGVPDVGRDGDAGDAVCPLALDFVTGLVEALCSVPVGPTLFRRLLASFMRSSHSSSLRSVTHAINVDAEVTRVPTSF